MSFSIKNTDEESEGFNERHYTAKYLVSSDQNDIYLSGGQVIHWPNFGEDGYDSQMPYFGQVQVAGNYVLATVIDYPSVFAVIRQVVVYDTSASLVTPIFVYGDRDATLSIVTYGQGVFISPSGVVAFIDGDDVVVCVFGRDSETINAPNASSVAVSADGNWLLVSGQSENNARSVVTRIYNTSVETTFHSTSTYTDPLSDPYSGIRTVQAAIMDSSRWFIVTHRQGEE